MAGEDDKLTVLEKLLRRGRLFLPEPRDPRMLRELFALPSVLVPSDQVDALLFGGGVFAGIDRTYDQRRHYEPRRGFPGGAANYFAMRAHVAWEAGSSVFWAGFALEQLRHLQAHGAMSPAFRRVIWPDRIDWLRGRADDHPQGQLFGALPATAAPEEGGAPAHANYLLLMPRSLEQIEVFEDAAEHAEAVVW